MCVAALRILGEPAWECGRGLGCAQRSDSSSGRGCTAARQPRLGRRGRWEGSGGTQRPPQRARLLPLCSLPPTAGAKGGVGARPRPQGSREAAPARGRAPRFVLLGAHLKAAPPLCSRRIRDPDTPGCPRRTDAERPREGGTPLRREQRAQAALQPGGRALCGWVWSWAGPTLGLWQDFHKEKQRWRLLGTIRSLS